jgi:hypothetical protein
MKIKISTRVVFIFKDYVIKIPISIRGYLQCKQEQCIWSKYGHLGLLGELNWYKKGIVCMKRYKPVKTVNHLDVFKVKNNIKEFDFDRCDLYKHSNWGKDDNGKRILIDYGINEEISKMYKV